MKKLITALIITSTAGFVKAEETSIPVIHITGSNADPATSLCIAATESKAALELAMTESPLNHFEKKSVACNGKPLRIFAIQFAKLREAAEIPVQLTAADDSLPTRLCIASVLSEDNYESVKAEAKAEGIKTEEMLCNDTPLNRFDDRFMMRVITAAL